MRSASAWLHQLRWRVGRGTAVSLCGLLCDSLPSDRCKARPLATVESQVARSWLQDAQAMREQFERGLTTGPTSCARGPRQHARRQPKIRFITGAMRRTPATAVAHASPPIIAPLTPQDMMS